MADNDNQQARRARRFGDTPRVFTPQSGIRPDDVGGTAQAPSGLHRELGLATRAFARGYLGTPVEMIDQAAALQATGHFIPGLSRQGVVNTLMPWSAHYVPQGEGERQLDLLTGAAGTALTPSVIGDIPGEAAQMIEEAPGLARQVGPVRATGIELGKLAQEMAAGPTAKATLTDHAISAAAKIAGSEAGYQLKQSGVPLNKMQDLVLDAATGGVTDFGYDVTKAGLSAEESGSEALRDFPRTYGRAFAKDVVSSGTKASADPAEEEETEGVAPPAGTMQVVNDETMPAGHVIPQEGAEGPVSVKVIPDETTMLDWHKPFEDQSKEVQQKLQAMHPDTDLSGANGREIYKNQMINNVMQGANYDDAKTAASLNFHNNGIPGTVADDGNSKGVVVFHPSSIQYSANGYQVSPVDYQPSFANAPQ